MLPLLMKNKHEDLNSDFRSTKNANRSIKKRQSHLNAKLVKDIKGQFTKLEI